jgi:hypothetical protein
VTLRPRVFDAVPLPGDLASSLGSARADVVIGGIEHAGASFELRVFVDNRGATADTPATPAEGYAGSVYVYGHGALPEGGGGQPSPATRLPLTRYVVATDAVRRAAAAGESASISLVPVAFSGPEPDVDLSGVEVSVIVRD